MSTFLNFLKSHSIILKTALLFTCLYNWAFFKHFNQAYPLIENKLFFSSICVVLFCVTAIVLAVLCYRSTTKIILGLLFIIGAFCAYYMNTYDIVIDQTMIQNVVQTSVKEASDLFTWQMVGYALVLGVLPTIVIFRTQMPRLPFKKTFFGKFKLIGLLLLIAGTQIFALSKNYASFFRENKIIRMYVNPIAPVQSAFSYAFKNKQNTTAAVAAMGEDARKSPNDTDRHLTILVVGETARADHFSLNGYAQKTNPLLEKEQVVSLHNFTSCGTSTAVSVPCMFSGLGRESYSEAKFNASENLLDVLHHGGVNVLWRDNNSDSKGVAIRLDYQDYKDAKTNTICDIECRDEGMLVGLQSYIDQHKTGDITIVLHQMGSHGPAYYNRYPKAFEIFTPTCQTNLLEKCSVTEINNTFDNTIAYTDYFLSKVIATLKPNAKTFQTSMVYMSDHGESLGENGVYLHGAPYFAAPAAQTHPAAIIWLGEGFKSISFDALKAKADTPFSHDNLFSTMLGLNKIETSLYNQKMDILKP